MKELCPACISDVHDEFITRLIEDGVPKIMRTYRQALAKDKNNYLILVSLYVNYFFMISNEFAFSALVLRIQTKSNFILLNQFGYIEGINQKFAEFIGG